MAPQEYRLAIEAECKTSGRLPPAWGHRKAILSDLSPAATYIASNYNSFVDINRFEAAAQNLLDTLKNEIGWMYKTTVPGVGEVLMEYTVWSEVLFCHSCSGEILFEKVAVDTETYKIRDEITCPHCGATGKKEDMELCFETVLDPIAGVEKRLPKRIPTKIFYKHNATLHFKEPDDSDLEVLSKIGALSFPKEFPFTEFPDSQMKRVGRMATTNINYVTDLFVPRAAHTMAALWRMANNEKDGRLRRFLVFMVEQAIWGLSALNRYQPSQHLNYGGSQVNRQLNGVYYIASMYAECSPWHNLDGKASRLVSAFRKYFATDGVSIISTAPANHNQLPGNSVDYIFTDPPFGENIYYADLNFLVESWHGVITDERPEAIIDRVRKKDVYEYQHAMEASFAEYYRVLKPGRWMTVVFSNSKASVWNAIQISLQNAGFVVAEVAALDKKTGSFKQVTSTTAVKQDLVISAYKPNGGLEQRFEERGAIPDSAWDFVQTHLKQIPRTKEKNGRLEFIIERDPRRIYDRMIAWFVRHDTSVPLSSDEFLQGLRQRYVERDGMVFLPDQALEYDKKRIQYQETPQLSLFVQDEASAIQWLRQLLREKPQTASDITPVLFKELQSLSKHEKMPDLRELLNQNFLCYDGKGPVPEQIHAYLSTNWKELRNLPKDDPALVTKARDRWYVPDPNKAGDLEKLREKALLKEFEEYKEVKKKLKVFRLEAVRAGFKKAWQERDYAVIVAVADKIPNNVLEEDPKLLMWYDQAVTRMGGE